MKNRLFFFANYEGRRDAQGTSVLRTVPSATLRAGNLVYLAHGIWTAAWTPRIVPAGRSTVSAGCSPATTRSGRIR